MIRRGRRSGLYTIVAVHSTVLGPALGGCRMWRYQSSADAARDALRLSRAMTFKAAAAGVPLGGGKGVIATEPGKPPAGGRRRDVLLDFADAVNTLEGRYVTAEDVGTSARDMAVLAGGTRHVTGLARSKGGSGDPSPFTAQGVEAALRACCERRFGTRDLGGRTVAVVGVGRVGSRLARRLAKAGAKLIVADIDEGKRELAQSIGARWEAPSTRSSPSGCAARLSAARPTTSSPTTGSPRTSPPTESSSHRTSSPAPVASSTSQSSWRDTTAAWRSGGLRRSSRRWGTCWTGPKPAGSPRWRRRTTWPAAGSPPLR